MKPTQFGLQRATGGDNSFSLHVVTDRLSPIASGLRPQWQPGPPSTIR